MNRIMIIRHGEKPTGDGLIHGVSHLGAHDKHDLSVRGWQRAGALVRFFAPVHHATTHEFISTPRYIFASGVTRDRPSLRSQNTVAPLAAALGLPVAIHLAEGEEEAVARAALTAEGPVLISWHHKRIPDLVRIITGDAICCPSHWPDDRFDVVWVLDHHGAGDGWTFRQVPQRLLPHDRDDTIPLELQVSAALSLKDRRRG
jgi:hypothetical protein